MAMEERIRFTRGTKVEVLNMKDPPFGSWRCAEIVSGDCRTYMVRYYTSNSATVKNTLGRVSHKFIRPYPPLLDISRTWVPGEVVEVFDNFSWRMGNVSRALGGNYFLVRLLGFSQVLGVCSSNIRARRSWQDGQWTLIGPGSMTCAGTNDSRRRGVIDTENYNFSGLRRRRACHRQDSQHLCAAVIPKSLRRLSLYFDSESEEGHYKRIAVRPPARPSSESNDNSRSIQSSISSCSVISSSNSCSEPPSDDILSAHSSDAESSCYNNRRPGNLEADAEVHRMELHAYHCTMEALCASGPLTWEQESLLTSLRMSLHISNDEHLCKLRQLVRVDRSMRVTRSYVCFHPS